MNSLEKTVYFLMTIIVIMMMVVIQLAVNAYSLKTELEEVERRDHRPDIRHCLILEVDTWDCIRNEKSDYNHSGTGSVRPTDYAVGDVDGNESRKTKVRKDL